MKIYGASPSVRKRLKPGDSSFEYYRKEAFTCISWHDELTTSYALEMPFHGYTLWRLKTPIVVVPHR